MISFYSAKRSADGVVNLGALGFPIQNNGQICLHNELYQQTTSITGTGCITADLDSTIFFANTLLNIDSNQVVYLADSQSSVRATAISLPKTFTIAGFGNGNKIGLDIPLVSLPFLSTYDYDSSSGILTLRGAGLLSQKFKIGLGYNKNYFKITTDTSLGLLSVPLGAVTYTGPVPNNKIPAQCKPCKLYPSAPGAEPTVTTTTVVSTKSDGSVCTDIDQIIISHDTKASWFTSTSVVSEICSTKQNSQTTKTSTWTGTFTTTVTETDTPGGLSLIHI